MVDRPNLMLGIQESYFADIGRVIACWSQIESRFDLLFLGIVVMDSASGSMHDPKVTLLGQYFTLRINTLKERIKELELPEDKITQLGTILSRLKRCRLQRDFVGHAVWSAAFRNGQFVEDEAVALTKSWEKDWKTQQFESEGVPQARLKTLIKQLDTLYWDLDALYWELHRLNFGRGSLARQ